MEGSVLMKTYLWIEDRKEKSGYIFWQTFMGQLCPEIVVESKKNNSELVKAVKALGDNENRYLSMSKFRKLHYKSLRHKS